MAKRKTKSYPEPFRRAIFKPFWSVAIGNLLTKMERLTNLGHVTNLKRSNHV